MVKLKHNASQLHAEMSIALQQGAKVASKQKQKSADFDSRGQRTDVQDSRRTLTSSKHAP